MRVYWQLFTSLHSWHNSLLFIVCILTFSDSGTVLCLLGQPSQEISWRHVTCRWKRRTYLRLWRVLWKPSVQVFLPLHILYMSSQLPTPVLWNVTGIVMSERRWQIVINVPLFLRSGDLLWQRHGSHVTEHWNRSAHSLFPGLTGSGPGDTDPLATWAITWSFPTSTEVTDLPDEEFEAIRLLYVIYPLPFTCILSFFSQNKIPWKYLQCWPLGQTGSGHREN